MTTPMNAIHGLPYYFCSRYSFTSVANFPCRGPSLTNLALNDGETS